MVEKYRVSKKLIFSRVSELEIFEYYFNRKINVNEPHINPLRHDKEPGCWFYIRYDGRLIFNDFAWRQFDCFDFVQYAFKVSFHRAMEIIYRDLIEKVGEHNFIKPELIEKRARQPMKLRIKRRKYRVDELAFWTLDGKVDVSEEELIANNIYALECYWENNVLIDNCHFVFAYHWFDYNYQIYFPRNRKPFRRFISPHGIKWGDMERLNPNETYLIITKSKKDAFYLRKFGLNAMFVISETVVLPDEWFDSVAHLDYLFTLFDNDWTGKRLSVKYRQRGCIPLLIPKERGKDFTEYIKETDLNDVIEQIAELKYAYRI